MEVYLGLLKQEKCVFVRTKQINQYWKYLTNAVADIYEILCRSCYLNIYLKRITARFS